MSESLCRREFMRLLAGAAAGLGMPRSTASPGDPAKPNFVYILCDDPGYGDLACYGHPIIKTPCLDKLASKGMKLTDCYAAARGKLERPRIHRTAKIRALQPGKRSDGNNRPRRQRTQTPHVPGRHNEKTPQRNRE